jgi:microcystin-dependent protein
MAGSISLSLSQQFDAQGRPLSGGLLYFFQSGTSTPQNAYKDPGLTLAHPNPMTLAADGRVPAFYLADGSIKIRLTDDSGLTIISEDGLLVIGPSSGGGSPPSVDATTVLATGDVKAKYGTGSLTGFVRLNARTIGSATSGGTERANADCQALFEYLWTADANLAVSGGRGGSANADWTANKTITLPDFRGRALAFLDDMGNSAAGRLTSSFFGTSAIVLGAVGGLESNTLDTAKIPSHTHGAGSLASDSAGAHTHFIANPDALGVQGTLGAGNILARSGVIGGGADYNLSGSATAASIGNTSSNGAHTHTVSGTSGATGTGNAHANVQPTGPLVTVYIKL